MISIGILETIEEVSLIFMYDNWISDVKSIFLALKDESAPTTLIFLFLLIFDNFF